MPKYRVPSFITKEYELEHVLALPAASRRRHNMYTTCAACHKQIETEFLYAGFAQGQPNRMFHFDCLDELSQAIIEYPKCQKCGEECREGQGECTGNYTHFECMDECPQCHSKDPDKMILACLPRHPWHNAKLAAPGTYRFVRFRGDVLMAEGVRVKATSEKEALEKAKKLYGPLQPNERFELMEFHAEGSACVL